MKKILAILICGVVAFASCSLPETVYKVTNVGDYITFKSGKLTNDYGAEYTVSEDQTDAKWAVDGNRFYAVLDILNIDYDITLKSYLNAVIQDPAGVLPDPAPESDPVIIKDCCIGGGYFNVILSYYKKAETDCPHNTVLYFTDDGAAMTLTLTLVHQGDGENPVNMDEESLKSVTALYSFPFKDLVPSGEARTVYFECDLLAKESSGNKYVSTHKNSILYTQQIQF